jgi:hypothetical protein
MVEGSVFSLARDMNVLFSTSSRPVLGFNHPPIEWVTEVLFPRVKWLGREADHSPPAIAELKKI